MPKETFAHKKDKKKENKSNTRLQTLSKYNLQINIEKIVTKNINPTPIAIKSK